MPKSCHHVNWYEHFQVLRFLGFFFFFYFFFFYLTAPIYRMDRMKITGAENNSSPIRFQLFSCTPWLGSIFWSTLPEHTLVVVFRLEIEWMPSIFAIPWVVCSFCVLAACGTNYAKGADAASKLESTIIGTISNPLHILLGVITPFGFARFQKGIAR